MPKPQIPDDISEIYRTAPIAYELAHGAETDACNAMMESAVGLLDATFTGLIAKVVAAQGMKPGVIVMELDFGAAKFMVAVKVDDSGEVTHWHSVIDRCMVEDDD